MRGWQCWSKVWAKMGATRAGRGRLPPDWTHLYLAHALLLLPSTKHRLAAPNKVQMIACNFCTQHNTCTRLHRQVVATVRKA